MADPLSLLASIAGVATAGVTISISLYEIAHQVKRAPKEVAEIAKELSMLSSILRNLKTVMKDTKDICKPRLITDTKELLGRIRTIYKEIREITRDSGSSLYRMKLLFRGSRTKSILAQIEGYKSTLNIILGTLQLATLQTHAKNAKTGPDPEVAQLKRLLQTLLLTGSESIAKIIDSNKNEPFSIRNEDNFHYGSSRRRDPRDRSAERGRSPIYNPRVNSRVHFDYPRRRDLSEIRIIPGAKKDVRRRTAPSRTPSPSRSPVSKPRPHTRTRINKETGTKEQRRVHPGSGRFSSYYESEEEHDPKKKSASSGEEYLEFDEEDDYSNESSDNGTEEEKEEPNTSTALILRSKSPPKESGETASKSASKISKERPPITVRRYTGRSSSLRRPPPPPPLLGGPRDDRPALTSNRDYLRHSVPPRSSMASDWNKQAAKWDRAPDDTATWLYRLVFMDQAPPMLGAAPKPLAKEEVPAAVTKLMIEWTSADPVGPSMSTPLDEGYQSQEGSNDEEWDYEVEKVIRNLKDVDWDPYDTPLDDDNPAYKNRGSQRDDDYPGYGTRENPYQNSSSIPPYTGPGYTPPYYGFGPPLVGNPYAPAAASSVVDSMNMTIAQLREVVDTMLKRIKELEDMGELKAKEANLALKRLEVERNAINDIRAKEKSAALEEMKCNHIVQIKEMEVEKAELRKENERMKSSHLEALERVKRQHDDEQMKKKKEEEEATAKRERLEQLELVEFRRMICFPGSHKGELVDSGLKKEGFTLAYPTPFTHKTAMHGTICWTRPFLSSASEMFEVLRISGWKPLWMRGSRQGETWFIGEKAVLVNFLGKEYAPQVAISSQLSGSAHGASITWTPTKDEYTAVGISLIERDAIEQLDLPYIGQYGPQYRFDVSVTYTDIENLVATSLLLRERRLRKTCRTSSRPRASTNGNSPTSPRPSISTDAEGSNGARKERPVDSEDEKYLRPRSTSNVESRNSQDEREAGNDGKKKHRKKRYI